MPSLLLCMARSGLARHFIGWVFTHMSFALPVKRLHETDSLIVFHHPQPSYAVHILLVPKRPFATLMDLPADETEFYQDLFATVQRLVREFDLEPGGYRLIANGGAYQDVPHLHFHLVADTETRSISPKSQG
jgi:histidine triad (HIT) family protein